MRISCVRLKSAARMILSGSFPDVYKRQAEPTEPPTEEPTVEPTEPPTEQPTETPTEEPTVEPTDCLLYTSVYGSLVKRLRLRPLTPATRVRFPHESPKTEKDVYKRQELFK